MNYQTINPPIKLFFAGWRANSHDLAQYGWEFSEIKYERQPVKAFLLRNEQLRIIAQTDYLNHHLFYDRNEFQNHIVNVSQFSTNMRYTHGGNAPMSYNHFDANYASYEEVEIPYNDTQIAFKPIQSKESQDIIVNPANVPELLDQILQAQEPRQKEIRQRILKERQTVKQHAKIISVN